MRAAAKGAMNGANAQGEAASASQHASESHAGQMPTHGTRCAFQDNIWEWSGTTWTWIRLADADAGASAS
eukprot:8911242-Lingulodinium_polyedra.AAC.1